MLLLMLYDADIPFMTAFKDGLGTTTQIPMLATTSVMASPVYRIGWGREPYHYYSKL